MCGTRRAGQRANIHRIPLVVATPADFDNVPHGIDGVDLIII
jgi:hypothetical protein